MPEDTQNEKVKDLGYKCLQGSFNSIILDIFSTSFMSGAKCQIQRMKYQRPGRLKIIIISDLFPLQSQTPF